MLHKMGSALLGIFLLAFAFVAAERTEFFQSYLFGYLVWAQIAIGKRSSAARRSSPSSSRGSTGRWRRKGVF